jgi:heat shock protein HslJ
MKIILAACLLLFIAACNDGTASNAPSRAGDTNGAMASDKTPDTTTLGGGWYLQAVLASDTASGTLPTLWFNMAKTHFSGNTGCNEMNGIFWYSDKDSSLSFSDKFVNAKMSCPGYNEKAFITSLMHANHYRLEKGMLILLTDNTELSRWTRKPAVASKTGKA